MLLLEREHLPKINNPIPFSGRSEKLERQYNLSGRLGFNLDTNQSTQYLDRHLLVGLLDAALLRNKIANLKYTREYSLTAQVVYSFQGEELAKKLETLEEEIRFFINSTYFRSSQEPNILSKAVNDLVTQSSTRGLLGVEFNPSAAFLEQWGEEWQKKLDEHRRI